jgi:DNA-binding NarL/FixJ family response regulator
MIRLLIAEDSGVVRHGLVKLLGNEQDMSVEGASSNGEAALQLLRAGLQCDVVLADLNMPLMDGFELSTKIHEEFPRLKVIILTMHAKPDFMKRAREAGVAGYLLKHLEPEELSDSIRLICSGIGRFM